MSVSAASSLPPGIEQPPGWAGLEAPHHSQPAGEGTGAGADAKARARRRRRAARWPDLAGIGSVVALAFAYISPALKDGPAFGGFDFVIPLTSLGWGTFSGPPFNGLDSDSVTQMNAWNLLDWSQIHAGHFPLWNNLSLLGLPQFLNFESSVLSLPDLVSYAVPLRFAFLVAVFCKLLIAGSGAYVLGRVLGLRPLGAAMAGVTFMLSGAFANWLTWPLSDVVSWLGWMAAFAVLSFRSPGRVRYLGGLALSVAFSLYGGFPEGNVFVAAALGVLAVAFLVASLARAAIRRGLRRPSAAGSRALLAGVARVGSGGLLGVMLALPLWWPGLQVLSRSHRESELGFPQLPAKALSLLVSAGYYGLPTRGTKFFLAGSNYYESVAYLGAVVAVLALVGLLVWWRHPSVLALAALVVVGLLVSYRMEGLPSLAGLLDHLSSQVEWERFRIVLGLPLGLLAGLGLESVVRQWRSRRVFIAYALGVAAVGTLTALLASRRVSGAVASAARTRSLYWPEALAVALAVSAVVWGVLLLFARPGRHAALRRGGPSLTSRGLGALLFVASSLFLLFSGVTVNTYTARPYPSTPAINELKHYLRGNLLGLDTGRPGTTQAFVPVGFYAEANVGYGVAEFAGHDPVIPEGYFSALTAGGGRGGVALLEPDIDTVSLARRYGISYVIVLPGVAPPGGALYVADLAHERLYYVPGAARFSLPAGGSVAAVSQPSPSSYRLVAKVPAGGATLTARVTDLPGWHATVDGKAEPLVPDGVMWSLPLPPGRHVVRLWYMPGRLETGLYGAGAGTALLLLLGLASSWRKRRGHLPGRRADPFTFPTLGPHEGER